MPGNKLELLFFHTVRKHTAQPNISQDFKQGNVMKRRQYLSWDKDYKRTIKVRTMSCQAVAIPKQHLFPYLSATSKIIVLK